MAQEDRLRLINQLSASLLRAWQPEQRNVDDLADIIREVLESERRGELSGEHAKVVISTAMAADMTRRLERAFGDIWSQWARAVGSLYHRPHEQP